jgi:hypothetical protein
MRICSKYSISLLENAVYDISEQCQWTAIKYIMPTHQFPKSGGAVGDEPM